jgi:hypothetical protein
MMCGCWASARATTGRAASTASPRSSATEQAISCQRVKGRSVTAAARPRSTSSVAAAVAAGEIR